MRREAGDKESLDKKRLRSKKELLKKEAERERSPEPFTEKAEHACYRLEGTAVPT